MYHVGQTKREFHIHMYKKYEHENNKSPDYVMNLHKNKSNYTFVWKNSDILNFECLFYNSIAQILWIKKKYSVNKT